MEEKSKKLDRENEEMKRKKNNKTVIEKGKKGSMCTTNQTIYPESKWRENQRRWIPILRDHRIPRIKDL